MIRVCVLSLFPAIFLAGCATEQAQAPVAPPVRVNASQQNVAAKPENEDISECARKSSIIGAWECVSKSGSSQ